MIQKTFMVIATITGVAGLVCTVISTIDQLKNADKRAVLSGVATGETIVKHAAEREEAKNAD